MSSITVEGNKPLVGEVKISGSKNAALALLYAALFSNEDVILENVPRLKSILADIVLIESIGGEVVWTGSNTLKINGSGINTSDIPYEVGSKTKTAIYLVGPLLRQFGKVRLPKYNLQGYSPSAINYFQYLSLWEGMGIIVEENDNFIELEAKGIHPGQLSFKALSQMGTNSAILTSLFVEGESVISPASEDVEVDSLIDFCNLLGGSIVRTEPRRIVVTGTNIFKGTRYKVIPNKTEAVVFATLAILTNGNLILRNVDRAAMVSFANLLTKLGVRYEFINNGLKVWHDATALTPTNCTISPTPGLLPEWKALITLLLNRASAESLLHDTVNVARTEYVTDFNRMGANIDLLTPSSQGIAPVIGDPTYDKEVSGEPKTLLRIPGQKKLRGEKLAVDSPVYGSDSAALLVGALSAEGKSYISGVENLDYYFENLLEKLRQLGAAIMVNESTS